MAEELIEETGLADVGPANDGRANPAAENLAFIGGSQEFVHEGDALIQSRQKLRFGIGGDVFIGEIYVGLHMRKNLQHIVAQFVDALG